MTGMLAASKAGHDKTQIYVIVREDEKYVYLCDGRLKTFQNPKKKVKSIFRLLRQERIRSYGNAFRKA